MTAFDPARWRLRTDADCCGLLRSDVEDCIVYGVGQRLRLEPRVTSEMLRRFFDEEERSVLSTIKESRANAAIYERLASETTS